MTRDGTVGRSDATETNLALHRDIDPVRMMRTRFADPIRASSLFGLHQQAGHMTASDRCGARQNIFLPGGGHPHMKRRKFLAGLAGAAVWPIAVLAQQPERMRRIAVLMNAAADDLQAQHHLAAFRRALQELNWTEGGNIQTDSRWGADDVETALRYAVELVALAPDVI